jgi:hypothetical protein
VSKTTRIIFPHEWDILREPIKELFGSDKEPPDPAMCVAMAVQEEDGKIIGFLPLQLVPHLEPFGSLGGASFRELKATIDEYIKSVGSVGYYAHFTDNPIGEAVAVSNGFKPIGMLYFGSPG